MQKLFLIKSTSNSNRIKNNKDKSSTKISKVTDHYVSGSHVSNISSFDYMDFEEERDEQLQKLPSDTISIDELD